jgi:ketosteroid isomerase-like protein
MAALEVDKQTLLEQLAVLASKLQAKTEAINEEAISIATLQLEAVEHRSLLINLNAELEGSKAELASLRCTLADKDAIITSKDLVIVDLEAEATNGRRLFEALSEDLQDQRDATLDLQATVSRMKAQLKPETVMGMAQSDVDNIKKEAEKAVSQVRITDIFVIH